MKEGDKLVTQRRLEILEEAVQLRETMRRALLWQIRRLEDEQNKTI